MSSESLAASEKQSSSLAAAAGWLLLAAAGQFITLRLIEAGKGVRYQHYLPLDRLFADVSPVWLLFILLQSVAVMIGLMQRRWQIVAWFRKKFRPWQLLLLAGLFVVTSATVSQDLGRYFLELITASYLQALSLGTVILAVWHVPDCWLHDMSARMGALLQKDEQDEGKSKAIPRVIFWLAIWVTLAAALLNVAAYERHPHVQDEVVYLLQARFFAAGELTRPAPPVAEGFEFYLMQFADGRWYPTPPPGWPLILALGQLVGLPWLVNPILAGLSLLLAYLLLRRFFSSGITYGVVGLIALSPWYLFLAMSFMTHISLLFFALLAANCVAQARAADGWGWAWLGGASLGMIALIRPLEGVIVALLLGLWGIGLGGRRLSISALSGLVLGAIIVGGLTLPYNYLLTGDPLAFPINEYVNERFAPNANALGFGPDRGMGWAIDPNPGHSPIDGLINANLNSVALNVELFGWSAGSLLFLLFFLVKGWPQGHDWHFIVVMAAVFAVYFLYYFSGGPDFGARYWFLMLVPLVLLTVRGIWLVGAQLPNPQTGPARVWLFVGLLSLLALINFLPWRAIDKYHRYLGMTPEIRTLAAEAEFGRSLVLIQGDNHPDYASAALFNPLDLTSEAPVYAWDRDEEVREDLIVAFPDRPVWLLAGPSITGGGYEILAGPLPSGSFFRGESGGSD